MVGLRAKVLGQMGWKTSPYLRAGALSCPSLAIYGPGLYGAPAFILSLAALVRPIALCAAFTFAWLCLARNFRRCNHYYPRWGGHTLCHGQLKGLMLGAPASLIGSELLWLTGSGPSLCPTPMAY